MSDTGYVGRHRSTVERAYDFLVHVYSPNFHVGKHRREDES